MGGQRVHLLERALVEEDVEPLARSELAALVLGLDAFGTAALAAESLQPLKLADPVFGGSALLFDCHR